MSDLQGNNAVSREQCDYSSAPTPSNYVCLHCNARGCKLWREAYEHDNITLLCVDCCRKHENKGYFVGEDGCHRGLGGMTDQIGRCVPAVPFEEDTHHYLPHGSVTETGVKWWTDLPLRLAPFGG